MKDQARRGQDGDHRSVLEDRANLARTTRRRALESMSRAEADVLVKEGVAKIDSDDGAPDGDPNPAGLAGGADQTTASTPLPKEPEAAATTTTASKPSAKGKKGKP